MSIDTWLRNLPQIDSHPVESDLSLLGHLDYPFLSSDQFCHQISRLSSHLGHVQDDLRRLIISYSLYVRQLDIIQSHVVKDVCKSHCGRPPVGCCNSNHFVILSLSDIMISRPSPLAMQLCDSIQRLQKNEDSFHGQRLARTPRYCDYLTSQGCTLRLFKSPLCIHYLCPTAEDSLRFQFQARSESFIEAMRSAASCTITSSTDFSSPEVIVAALCMVASPESSA